jgi:hypothetical protein
MRDAATLNLSWKAIAVLPSDPPIQAHTDAFNCVANTGLFSQFGIPRHLAYVPFSLNPTVRFHQTLRNMLKKRGYAVREPKFPYRIFVPQLDAQLDLNIRIRLFLPNILSLTISLSAFSTALDVQRLIDFQNLGGLAPISDLVHWIAAMCQTLQHVVPQDSFTGRLRVKPLLHLHGVSSPEQFQETVNQDIAAYVGMLIRNSDYKSMNRELVDRIVNQNSEHNVKSSMRLLLLNKQGTLYITPTGTTDDFVSAHLPRVHDLVEIAVVLSAYIENFKMLRAANEELADFFLYKIRPFIESPELVFRESVTNTHIWLQLCHEFKLKPLLQSEAGALMPQILEKTFFFDQFSDWWTIPEFGYVLAKKALDAKELHFGFIDDPDLKRGIIEDYMEAQRSLASRNFKATIVLCGSIAEAVLTSALLKHDSTLVADKLYKKSFEDLINAAKQESVITDNSLIALLEPLRQYRNLIHPGRSKRLELSTDTSKAQISVETIKLLVKHLDRP